MALLIQFVLLIVDRALYLRRNMNGKIIFHVISVVAVHCWQFFQLYHESPMHSVNWPPMLFYFIKCIYFLLSSYQIRCGYPKQVSGNFTNNRFTLLHRRVFQLYVRLTSLQLWKKVLNHFYFLSISCGQLQLDAIFAGGKDAAWLDLHQILTNTERMVQNGRNLFEHVHY